MALKLRPDAGPPVALMAHHTVRDLEAPVSRKAQRCASKVAVQTGLEPPLVQILVVVANIQSWHL